MNSSEVEKVANAVLYEGYLLYPYRPSAVKNRQRWNFGVISPQSPSPGHGDSEPAMMQTECLALGDDHSTLHIKIRFLHLLAREVAEVLTPTPDWREGSESDLRVVEALEIGGQIFQTWQEAVDRVVQIPSSDLLRLTANPLQISFSFPYGRETTPLRDPQGRVAGIIVRRQELVEGLVEVAAQQVTERLFRITVRILNLTSQDDRGQCRDDSLRRSLVSTHTILRIQQGQFVSLLDPPDPFRQAADACRNLGTWPVLAGEEGESDTVLSSPIILYDYPKIAPESCGDLFDSTEIDELLTLRILTLTDEEKDQMRHVDDRARQILERAETLQPEQLMKLHGTLRGLEAAKSTNPERGLDS
ncbi:MAG: hypothetical protein AB1898_26635 [Acidobacteriota bacterium]